MANSTDNVSVGLGVAGGYIFVAPKGTTLPTDATTTLANTYKVLGYVTEDGITFGESGGSDDINDMNGDVIATTKGNVEKTLKVTFAETNEEVLKLLRGSSNVTTTSGAITVLDKGLDMTSHVIVCELLLKNARKWRVVIEEAQLSEVGDVSVNHNDLVAFESTFKMLLGSTTGAYKKEFFAAPSTSGGGNPA